MSIVLFQRHRDVAASTFHVGFPLGALASFQSMDMYIRLTDDSKLL